ncbi:acyl carrier protein [Reyranella sp.]|jgi:acyl carrier protein|uniref:acyl carrier protein n=1 Tax=Reyranella sp. TaxID=1929291 RepID=UPI00271A0504|nr:acyl carrier protein [Reyranella sp.]MDO8972549.1 acyl carrier protein [Reyranella sp.]
MQAVQELVAPPTSISAASSLQYDVMREIFSLLAPYNAGGKAITPQTVISKGLTVDSLTIMDVIMELEDRFDVTIPMNVAADIVTIDQLAEAVVSQRARR